MFRDISLFSCRSALGTFFGTLEGLILAPFGGTFGVILAPWGVPWERLGASLVVRFPRSLFVCFSVHVCLRVPALCYADWSPIIYGNAFVDISDVLFCEPESQQL